MTTTAHTQVVQKQFGEQASAYLSSAVHAQGTEFALLQAELAHRLLQREDRGAQHLWRAHALDPRGVFQAQALTAAGAHMQAGFAELLHPFGSGVIAHVAGVAQHFDGLQIGVEQRAAGRNHIDERRHTTRLEHPTHFTQGHAQIAPVMRRITAEHVVEFTVRKRQALGRTAHGTDIAQPAIDSRRADHIEHLLRQVVGHKRVTVECRLLDDVGVVFLGGTKAMQEHDWRQAARAVDRCDWAMSALVTLEFTQV